MADQVMGAARAVLGQGLMMGWGDEAEAWLRSKLGQGDYNSMLQQVRNKYAQYNEEHPVASGIGEFVGGAAPIAAGMLVPGGQPASVARLSTLAAKYLPSAIGKVVGAGVAPEALNFGQSVARASGVGAGVGAVSGAGGAEGDRGAAALGGGALGAGIGAAGSTILRAGKGAVDIARRMLPTEVGAQKVANQELAKVLSDARVSPQQLEALMRRDAAMGVPSTVANASSETAKLAQVAAQRSAKAGTTIEDSVKPNLDGARQRVFDRVKQSLSPAGDYFDDLKDIQDSLKTKAKPFYDQAYAHGELDDPRLGQILQDPIIQRAFENAKEYASRDSLLARMHAARQGQPLPDPFSIKQIYDYKNLIKDPITGGLTLAVREVPDVRTLDYVKRGIDGVIQRGLDGSGPLDSTTARQAIGLKKELLAIMDEKVPSYAHARQLFAGDKEVENALVLGKNEFHNMAPEEILNYVAEASPSELDAFRTGVTRGLYDTIMKPDSDINAAKKIIGSPLLQEKLEPLFDNAGQFRLFKTALEREREINDQARGMLARVGTGETAQMESELSGDPAAARAVGHYAIYGAKSALASLVNSAIRHSKMSAPVAEKLADHLTKGPSDVAAVVKILEEQAAKTATSAKVAGARDAGIAGGIMTSVWPAPTENYLPPEDTNLEE